MATQEIEQQPPHPHSPPPLPIHTPPTPIHPSATVSIQPDTPKLESDPTQPQPPRPLRRRHRSPWLSRAYHAVGATGLAWSTLCIVRYAIAVSEYRDDRMRENYAVAFVVLSVLGWLSIASIQLVRFAKLPISRYPLIEQVGLLFTSLCVLTPALFNLAFVALWRHSRGDLSLSGRCRWDIDVVWSGRSRVCMHGVSWGLWLAGAILRVVLTLAGLSAMHTLAWISNDISSLGSPRSGSRPRSHSTQSLVGGSGSPSNPNRLRKKHSPQLPVYTSPPESIQDHRRTFSSSTNAHGYASYTPNHFLRSGSPTPVNPPPRSPSRMGQHAPMPSPRSSDERPASPVLEPRRSNSSEYYPPEQDDGGDLNRFAVNFRSLVERVTRETEDGARLPPSPTSRIRSETPPSSFPGRTSTSIGGRTSPSITGRTSPLDPQLQLQRDLLQAHRLMLIEQAMRAESYEHVVVLGNAVRRMSTIPSIADSALENPPWTPNSANSAAASVSLVRSPTGSTARSGRKGVGRREREREGHTPPSTGGSGDSPEEEG